MSSSSNSFSIKSSNPLTNAIVEDPDSTTTTQPNSSNSSESSSSSGTTSTTSSGSTSTKKQSLGLSIKVTSTAVEDYY